MPVLDRMMTFTRAGVIGAMIAGLIAPAAQAGPMTARIAPVKVFLSCKLAPTAENLAFALTITNSSKLAVPNSASITYTQALGKPAKYHTVITTSAVVPGGQFSRTVADSNLAGGPCTAWFMSSPLVPAPSAM